MRDITIGETKVRVRANPLALLYYKQEFRTDLAGDMVKMRAIQADPSQFDSIVILQITWAMAKAATSLGSAFPTFIEWLSNLDDVDFSDPNMLQAVMEEAADGFFRRGFQSRKQK